jgi:hypothetical protein
MDNSSRRQPLCRFAVSSVLPIRPTITKYLCCFLYVKASHSRWSQSVCLYTLQPQSRLLKTQARK